MSQAASTASSDYLGTINFGSRGGGNSWIVIAIAAAVVIVWLVVSNRRN